MAASLGDKGWYASVRLMAHQKQRATLKLSDRCRKLQESLTNYLNRPRPCGAAVRCSELAYFPFERRSGLA
jgi:hypothetical protein